MSFKVAFVLFAIGLVVPALGYSAGAPSDACDDMVPQHGTDAQKKPAPYELQVSRKSFRSGDKIQLTLAGKRNHPFKGFMIEARQGNKRVGSFLVDPNDPYVQTIDCGSDRASAATHKKLVNPRDSITVTWAPNGFTGDFNFRSTIAYNGSVFWVGEESDRIKVV